MAPDPTVWRSVLISMSHLRQCLQSGLFPSGFPTKCGWYLPPIRGTSSPHRVFLYLITWIIVVEAYRQKLFLRQSCTLSSYLAPLRPQYNPQYRPIIENLELTNPLQCASPRFTPTHKNWQIIILSTFFSPQNFMTKVSAQNDGKNFQSEICSQFHHDYIFYLLVSLPNTWIFEPFKGFITYLYVLIFPVFFSQYTKIHLVFSAFTARTIPV